MKKIGMKKMVGARKRGAPMPKMMAAPKAMRPMAMEGQTPPMAGPMPQGIPGMKKGGAVKKGSINKKTWGSTEDIMGTGPSPAAAKADYAKKMKAAGLKPKMAKGGMAKAPKGGLGIMIILGKKKGK